MFVCIHFMELCNALYVCLPICPTHKQINNKSSKNVILVLPLSVIYSTPPSYWIDSFLVKGKLIETKKGKFCTRH